MTEEQKVHVADTGANERSAESPSPLYGAAINCPHTITAEAVVLRFDPNKPGHNALSQLARRLDEELRKRLSDVTAERDAARERASELRTELEDAEADRREERGYRIKEEQYARELKAACVKVSGWLESFTCPGGTTTDAERREQIEILDGAIYRRGRETSHSSLPVSGSGTQAEYEEQAGHEDATRQASNQDTGQ